MCRLIVLLTVWIIGVSGFADLKLARIFSDGMVLQQGQTVSVWGWADPGTTVTVEFAGQKKEGVAGAIGKWHVKLDPMMASSESRTLSVHSSPDSRHLTLANVLVGEVWLCSGQSNMHMAVKEANNFPAEKAGATYPLIRMFSTGLVTGREMQEDCTGSWVVCSPECVGDFSAAAYFFGRQIHRELGVPVGLIRSAWGGTPIEAWSPMASLETFPAAMEYKAQEDRKAETFDEAAAEKYNARLWGDYNQKVELAKANGTKWPPWPEEKIHPQKSHRYPANLYNTMIHPLMPYGMRGAIWYQGENNTKTIKSALLYRELLENLIVQWRKGWGAEFPFYAVQLVNFHAPQTRPAEDAPWVFIRESFLRIHKEVPNTGIAVGIDVGEANNIHPKNKQAIGYRLAQQALAKTYEKNVVAGGPIYESMQKDGDRITIKFDDIGSGLIEQGGAPLKTFAIAGANKKFVAAQAVIVGDTVIVSSPEIAEPVAVRYAWADNPVGCNLFNKEGFPAAPFRTDDWPPAAE